MIDHETAVQFLDHPFVCTLNVLKVDMDRLLINARGLDAEWHYPIYDAANSLSHQVVSERA